MMPPPVKAGEMSGVWVKLPKHTRSLKTKVKYNFYRKNKSFSAYVQIRIYNTQTHEDASLIALQ